MSFAARLAAEIQQLQKDGVYKRLNYLESPQGARVRMEGRGEVVILSSNNYLGLCNVPEVVQAGRDALDKYGAGTGSVRFICGTFTVHRELEQALARFVGCESSLSYVSCWNANEGLCPTLLTEQDIVISDQLNHASIIDSVRLAKAITKCQTAVYKHSDMADLEDRLKAASGNRLRLIFTDGIFSMEGDIARLPDIVALAKRYDAVVAMDDSHATGVLGKTGRGTAEHFGMLGQVDIITSTLGKALGGAAGGFTAGPAALTDYLTQRSRPQLFSNALPPTVAASALAAVKHAEGHPEQLGGPPAREREVLPRPPHGAGVQAAAGRDADHTGDPGRDVQGDSDERAAVGRGCVRDGLRIPGGSTGPRAGALPGLRGAFPRRPGLCARGFPEGGEPAGADLTILASTTTVVSLHLTSLLPKRPTSSSFAIGWLNLLARNVLDSYLRSLLGRCPMKLVSRLSLGALAGGAPLEPPSPERPDYGWEPRFPVMQWGGGRRCPSPTRPISSPCTSTPSSVGTGSSPASGPRCTWAMSEAFFTTAAVAQITDANSGSGVRNVSFSNVRRLSIGVMAIPLDGHIQPMIGGGFSIVQILNPVIDCSGADATTTCASFSDSSLAAQAASDQSSKAFAWGAFGLQINFGRLGLFGQATVTSAAQQFMLDGPTYSVVAGLRYSLGSSKEDITESN